MSSEFARIDLLASIFHRESAAVALGIGDDAAVLRPSTLPQVWTVDAAVEGVHFSRAWLALDQAAERAFMAAASDVAAMGARAVAALSALTLPRDFSDEQLALLAAGLARAADGCACPIIGGNLARAEVLTLTTTVIGECPGRLLTRAGAQPGDGIYVTGTLGGAALGLQALQRGRADDPVFDRAIARFRAPRARLDRALEVAAIASAAVDVSDGLAPDLAHLCRASAVGADVECAALPLEPEFAHAAAQLGLDPIALALSGGEDYELLFTSSAAVAPELARRIGVITDAGGRVLFRDLQGRELAVAGGFDHFAES